MRRSLLYLGVFAAGFCAAAQRAQADEQAGGDFSYQAVDQAIQKAVDFLWSQQGPEGNWPAYRDYKAGPTALAAFALLDSGVSAQDGRMVKALEWLKNTEENKTYTLGLRCNVWQLANRQTRGVYLPQLKKDVETLVLSTKDGSYGYTCAGDGGSSGDNSCSQYGLLGVWAGAMANLEIPPQYWQKVTQHWLACQDADGGWSYHADPNDAQSTRTMTAAGVASLLVCMDNLASQEFTQCDRRQDWPPLQRGLRWLERNFTAIFDGEPDGYYLFGIERVALASGQKYFGAVDWYKTGAGQLLAHQGPQGQWSHWGDVPGTAFGILFLARGRNPVLFSKLQYDGDWNNRPRDLASLTRWLGDTLERPVNWQIVNLKTEPEDWHDSPILYLAGSRLPTFSQEDLDKLRRFVWQGGTIFSVTECSGAGFGDGMRKTYATLFPQCKMQRIPADHDIYKAYFKLPGRPVVNVISNGVRALAIHVDEDLPLSWQMRRTTSDKWAFQAAANIAMYVTDLGAMELRGASSWPKEQPFLVERTIRLAVLKHGGNWDPEPLAFQRLQRLMASQTRTDLEIVGPLEAKDLPDSGATAAVLTGAGEIKLSAADRAALKSYVESGGTLIATPAGGARGPEEPLRQLLVQTFGAGLLRPLPPSDPLYVQPLKDSPGLEIRSVRYRRLTVQRLGRSTQPRLSAIILNGRPGVLYSQEDIVSALVGYASFGVDGYAPGADGGSAFQIMRNILLRASENPPPAPPAATLPAKHDRTQP